MWRATALVSISACLFAIAASTPPETWSEVLERYNPEEKPPNVTLVRINTYVRAIKNLNSHDHTYQVQLTFRQQWNDPRLELNDESSKGLEYRMLDRSRIWKPDLFFSNELEGSRHMLTTENSLVRVYPNGDILMSERLSLKLTCPMNLASFPFDMQKCSILMASYGYTTESLIFLWKEGDPVQVTKNLHQPEFDLTKFSTDYCTARTNTGEYSCLRADFIFRRSWEYYLRQVFIPMTMLCLIGWLTFFVSDTTMRTTMLMFTLSLAVVCTGAINYSLPRTGYTKAIDTFLGGGMTFIFGALVEFVIVKWLEARQEKESLADKIDWAFRFLYPIAYVAFILLYLLTV